MRFPFYTLCLILFALGLKAQETIPSDSIYQSFHKIKGRLLNIKTQEPLPYANIAIQRTNTGTITNEKGEFSINVTGLSTNDSVSFLYIGFKTKHVPVALLDSFPTIYLQEDIQNLNQIIVFAHPPKAKDIIKNIIKYKDSNYIKVPFKNQTFIRERSTTNIPKFKLHYKKSSLPDIDRETIKKIEQFSPRETLSYTDFLGDVYFSATVKDSIPYKINPIKIITLKEKNYSELEDIGKQFEHLLHDTTNKDYWKFTSGIFSQRLDLGEDTTTTSTTNDSTALKNTVSAEHWNNKILIRMGFISLGSESDWQFLYAVNKYEYEIIGGTQVNGEDAYVIDFVPKRGGLYEGRLFVSMETYALIRADYAYAPGKTGTDIHLFGIGYTENYFTGSIYFEKINGSYQLKYCARKKGQNVSFERKVGLVKKRERFLFDKTLNELKLKIDIDVETVESFEIFVLNHQPISLDTFKDYKQDKRYKVLYVDQFDAQLWKGYSIIEPTQQMRDYKKR